MEIVLTKEQCQEIAAHYLFQDNIYFELDFPRVRQGKFLDYVKSHDMSTLVSYLVHNFPLLRSFCALGLPLEGENYNILMYAIVAGDESIFNLMMELGADVNSVIAGGFRPLHLALCHNRTTFVEELLVRGADPNVETSKKRTPLHIAIRRGSMSQITLCCRHGAIITKDMCNGTLDVTLKNIRRAQKIDSTMRLGILEEVLAKMSE